MSTEAKRSRGAGVAWRRQQTAPEDSGAVPSFLGVVDKRVDGVVSCRLVRFSPHSSCACRPFQPPAPKPCALHFPSIPPSLPPSPLHSVPLASGRHGVLHLVAEEGRRGGGHEEGARGEAVPDRAGRLAIAHALALSWYVRAASPSSSSSFAVREFFSFFFFPNAGAPPVLGRVRRPASLAPPLEVVSWYRAVVRILGSFLTSVVYERGFLRG